jgi:hypothetical protein
MHCPFIARFFLPFAATTLVAAPLLAGCSAASDDPSAHASEPAHAQGETLSCAETLDAFCSFPVASANECVYRSSYQGALAVACNSTNIVALTHAFSSCGGYEIIGTAIGASSETLYFDAATGALVAVVDAETGGSTSCIAGPTSFTVPVCTDDEGTPCGNAAAVPGGG